MEFHAAGPPLWRRPKAASIMVDADIDGSIYGTIYPAIYGSQNGAVNNNPSGRISKICGRIIQQPVVYIYIIISYYWGARGPRARARAQKKRPGPSVRALFLGQGPGPWAHGPPTNVKKY